MSRLRRRRSQRSRPEPRRAPNGPAFIGAASPTTPAKIGPRLDSRGLHSIAIAHAVEDAPRGDAKDEAIELFRYIDDPKEEAQRVRGLLSINYIGGSVASAAVNLSQTFNQT